MTKKKVQNLLKHLPPAVPDRYPAFLYGSYKLFQE